MGCACGAFNGFLVSYLNVQPMVATLILFSAARAIGLLLCNNMIVYVRDDSFKIFGGYLGFMPTPIVVAIVCILITSLVLRKTALGLYIQSVGINKKASRIAGINSERIIFLCYVVCGLCAGIAGIVASSRISSADSNNIGLNFELDAILAVALGGNSLGGGKFRLAGSIIGAYTIQAITTTLYALGISTEQAPVYKAVIVIIIVAIQAPPFKAFMKKNVCKETACQRRCCIMKAKKIKWKYGSSDNYHRVIFFVMYAVGCVIYSNKGFTHLQTFLNILINNAGLLCITCGMTCVMLTGGIDISVGSLVAMDCMILAVGMERWNMNAVLLCILVLAIGIVFGVVQGFCVGYLNIQPFIVTMAGMFFARGMTAVISTEQISISSNAFFVKLANTKISLPFGSYTNNKGVVQVPFIRVSVIVALLVLIAVFFMLRYTKFGRSLYAVGGSEQSATMMGLDVKKTKLKAYVLSSFLCSIGGICYCLNTMSGNVQQALGLEMDAIASSVIGGTLLTGGVGNVIGSFFGVLINGTISTLVKTNGKLLSSWSNIAVAALLCFFIVLQSIFAKIKEKSK